MRERGAEWAGGCGVAGRGVFPSKSGRVRRGEEVVLNHCLESGIVVVVVDAKVKNESMLRGSCVG